MENREMVMQIVQRAYELCSQLMPVHACWLYGSYARGDFDAESDVDIMISVDMSESELRQYRRSVAQINSSLSLEHDVTVSITVKSADSVARYSSYVPYYRNVLQEGWKYA